MARRSSYSTDGPVLAVSFSTVKFVGEGYGHIFMSMMNPKISVSQRGVQRHLWVSDGFRDIFVSVRGSETSLGQ